MELDYTTYPQQSLQIASLEHTLAYTKHKSLWWEKDMCEHLAVLKRENLSVKPWIPAEFSQFGDHGEKCFREYLAHSGKLFSAWPELWNRSR